MSFKVLKKSDKYITLDLKTRVDNAYPSKAAHLPEHNTSDNPSSTVTPSPRAHHHGPTKQPALDQPATSYDKQVKQPTPIPRTRTGRAIRRPKRCVHFIFPHTGAYLVGGSMVPCPPPPPLGRQDSISSME